MSKLTLSGETSSATSKPCGTKATTSSQPAEQPRPYEAGLFRQEALVHKSNRLTGVVTLAQPVAFSLLISFVILIVAIAIFYLTHHDYTRKESVKGYLQPTRGLVKAFIQSPGVLANLLVQEGDEVVKGDVIAQIEIASELVNGEDINQQMLNDLSLQQYRLSEEINDERILSELGTDKLNAKLEHLKAMRKQKIHQQGTLSKHLALSQKQLSNGKRLFVDGHLSEQQVTQLEEQYLTLSQQHDEFSQNLLIVDSELKQTRFDIVQKPLLLAKMQASLEDRIVAVKQRIYQLKFKQSYQIKASRSGRVTNVLAKVGQTVQAHKSLLTILPKQAKLQAILLVPTHSFGFVNEGQQALMRYQAFPYQRFGLFAGKISEVSKAVLMPEDLSLPIGVSEPVYKVTVDLEQQHVIAYGNNLALHPGMLLEADIVIDKRSLWQWLLEPLYSLRGRI
ncbi:hypothetical protein A9Q98_12285 [Thalassotalea sp. 42_200_T64]|nr:hypothetical protein A9Q98_12285 [Thalassotalea sp. 42_200_T64]